MITDYVAIAAIARGMNLAFPPPAAFTAFYGPSVRTSTILSLAKRCSIWRSSTEFYYHRQPRPERHRRRVRRRRRKERRTVTQIGSKSDIASVRRRPRSCYGGYHVIWMAADASFCPRNSRICNTMGVPAAPAGDIRSLIEADPTKSGAKGI